MIQNKHGHKSYPETSSVNYHLMRAKGGFLREVVSLRRKKKGESKVLSREFCLRDSKAEQRVLKSFHIYFSNVNSYSSALESNRQNPPYRTMDLPFFFRCKHIASRKNVPSLAPSEILPHWFQGNFATVFVFNYWLREFPLSAFANLFELRCEPRQLMLLYYKICPCWDSQFCTHGLGTFNGSRVRNSSVIYRPFKFNCYVVMFKLAGQFKIWLGHNLLFSKGNV